MHNLRVVGWVLFGAKWGLQPSDSSERLFQSGSRGRSMYKISVKGEFNTIKCLLYKRFSATQEDLMSSGRGLVLFSRYEEIQGLESWNQFLKIPSHLKSSPTRSLEHRVPPSTLSSLRGCWRSAAATAQGSVSAEADGKCPCSVTGNALQFSRSVVSDSLRPHGLQQARLPSPSPAPRACSNSCPLSQWCHPTISSSVVPFSYLQSFQHQSLFQWVSSSHQVAKVLGVSASASVLPMNIQDWFPLGLTGRSSCQVPICSWHYPGIVCKKYGFC